MLCSWTLWYLKQFLDQLNVGICSISVWETNAQNGKLLWKKELNSQEHLFRAAVVTSFNEGKGRVLKPGLWFHKMHQAHVTDWGNVYRPGCMVIFPSWCQHFRGVTWIAKMADHHLVSYWANDLYQLNVLEVVCGKCRQSSKTRTPSLTPLTHQSCLLLFWSGSTDLQGQGIYYSYTTIPSHLFFILKTNSAIFL